MVKVQRKKATFEIGEGGSGDGMGWDGWSRGGEGLPLPTAKLGLWLLLGAIAMLFAAFSSAYIARMPLPDWVSTPKPPLLWFNTAVLIISSLTAQWAWVSAKRGRVGKVRKGLVATTALGLTFVAGQLMVWKQMVDAGIYLQTNPSSSFFYLLTAAHGLHLLGGIIALVWTTVRAWRNEFTPHRHLPVELCVVYWHFLTLVWLWLLALMSLR